MDRWNDILAAFALEVHGALTSQVIIWGAVGGEDLAQLAQFDYVQSDPNTWLSSSTVHTRVVELMRIALDEIDRRIPAPTVA